MILASNLLNKKQKHKELTMATNERIIIHMNLKQVDIDKNKYKIYSYLYNNGDLQIEAEDLTTRNKFLCLESASNIERFTAECKVTMTSSEFYDIIESSSENLDECHCYQFTIANDVIIFTVLINYFLARGKILTRSFPLTLKKQEQNDINRIANIVDELIKGGVFLLNTKNTLEHKLDNIETSIFQIKDEMNNAAKYNSTLELLSEQIVQLKKSMDCVEEHIKQSNETKKISVSDIQALSKEILPYLHKSRVTDADKYYSDLSKFLSPGAYASTGYKLGMNLADYLTYWSNRWNKPDHFENMFPTIYFENLKEGHAKP